MLVSWYLPTLNFSLWPCAALLGIFVPITVWHELSWRRTLAEYARRRSTEGAADAEWPSADLRIILAAQPWLLTFAAALLGAFVALAIVALLIWPQAPQGFVLPINYFDLPYLWTAVVAGLAAITAALAVALEAARSPWSAVARHMRRATHASPELRERFFAEALSADPGVRDGRANGA